MRSTITTLVLPVAGVGKRLLPLTLTTPKNLLLVNGRPLIEYVLDEAVRCGIRDVVLVANQNNRSDFERYARKNRSRYPSFRFHIRVQETPGGNGHALLSALDIVGNKPFVVRFCDDIVMGDVPVTASLIALYRAYGAPIILLERVPDALVPRFGVVRIAPAAQKIARKVGGKVYRITEILEKPKLKDAPSNLTIVGGYVLTSDMVHNLERIAASIPSIANDALPIAVMAQIELVVGKMKIYGWEFPGTRLDCGTLESLKKTERYLAKRQRNISHIGKGGIMEAL